MSVFGPINRPVITKLSKREIPSSMWYFQKFNIFKKKHLSFDRETLPPKRSLISMFKNTTAVDINYRTTSVYFIKC